MTTDPTAPVYEEAPPTDEEPAESEVAEVHVGEVALGHLRGLVEALVFASDRPLKAAEIGKLASAPRRQITKVLEELRAEYQARGIQLDEIAGGWAFRTNAAFAPFVRELTGQRPVRLSRAQIETLAIIAYRQPITRPEIDDIRGVDCGAVLRMLLERDLVRILGKKDEPGRPILYGTSTGFLELFGLKSLKDLPTLREFTELNEDSKRVVEKELGEQMEAQVGDEDRETLPSPEPPEAETESLPPSDESEEPETDPEQVG